MIESQHLTNTNTQHLTDLIYIKFWHSSSSVSHTYTTSVGRTRCDFFFVFIFCLHQHFLQGEEFPLVYIPLTWTSSTPSFFEPVPDLVTGTLAAGILFFILANFFFSTFQSLVLLSSHSAIYFTTIFCQQNTSHSLFAFHLWILALSVDWEVNRVGTVFGFTCVYVYLSAKSPSSKPQSLITVSCADVGEKALTC